MIKQYQTGRAGQELFFTVAMFRGREGTVFHLRSIIGRGVTDLVSHFGKSFHEFGYVGN